jgi:hypothetical protein
MGAFGHGQDTPPHGKPGQDVIGDMRRRRRHVPAVARWEDTASDARKRDQEVVAALSAAGASERASACVRTTGIAGAKLRNALVSSGLNPVCAHFPPVCRMCLERAWATLYDGSCIQRSRRQSPEYGGESGTPACRIQPPNSRKPNQEPNMNRYEPSSPRAVIGIVAVAMAALSLGLAVLPATLNSYDRAARIEAAARGVGPAATEVTLIPGPITVYGVREEQTAFEPPRPSVPERKDAG